MVPAYYAVLEDIGYLIRHERRKRAGETLRERDMAFQYEELSPYMKKMERPFIKDS